MLKFIKKLKRGFTLVELLVVMGILGVLAAGLIALINPADRIKQANDTKALADLNQMVGAVNAFAAANEGSFPVVAGAASATGWNALFTALSAELSSNPTYITNYTYAVNCAALGPCKISVKLLSKKNLGVAATATACWVSTGGGIQTLTGAAVVPTAGAGCP